MKRALVAFSGGLDTSFLVAFCKERYGFEHITTCTVDTGGFSREELDRIEERAYEVGADEHVVLDASKEFYDSILKYLIYGNVTRDGYPLCVSSERLTQGKRALELCVERGIRSFIHGCTGAGNDQYRFDLVAQVLGRGEIESIAPIRELGISRQESTEFLQSKGIGVSKRSTDYSYNPGLWGVSIGGAETHSSTSLLPDEAWYSGINPSAEGALVVLTFEEGEMAKLTFNGTETTDPIECIRLLSKIGGGLGIGRHYHVGTSIPGKKGRIAYESPAADILYEAHRTLEKITLTGLQISGKKGIAEEYGRLLHEARFLDPYFQDLGAFLKSSQRRVTGECTVYLEKGYIKAVTADSPHNLTAAKGAVYGESSSAYSGSDAAGACKLHAFEQMIYHSMA